MEVEGYKYLVAFGSRREQCNLYENWLSKQKEGQLIEVTYTRKHPDKTNEQLRYYHGLLMSWAEETFLNHGHNTLPEFKILVNGVEHEIETNKDNIDLMFKQFFFIYKNPDQFLNKADMSIEQMSQYIEYIIDYFLTKFGKKAPEAKKK